LDFEIWPNIWLSPLSFTLLGDIDLIFGMRVYNHKLQINLPKIKSISQIIVKKKVMTTKYLAKFQSQTAVSWPKIIQPE
jgi:hypothetical protein